MARMRKRNYNVITSLARFQNIKALAKMLSEQDVTWHIVHDDDLGFEVKIANPYVWTHACPTPPGPFWFRCHSALNWFLDSTSLWDDEYYCFLNDDDFYEPGFFDKVDQAPDSPVYITSMKRGNQTPQGVDPVRAHGVGTLHASLEQMSPGYVGLEQGIIIGSVLKQCRIPLNTCGDGQMISHIARTYPTLYLPEAYVWFNFLEPGRWT